MNIQANINQLLSIAAVAARLDPTVQTRAQTRSAKKTIASAEKKSNIIVQAAQNRLLTSEEKELKQELGEKISSASSQIFEAKPTLENYQKMQENIKTQKEFEAGLKQEKAQEESAKRKASIQQQLRDEAEAQRAYAEEARREEIRQSLLNWRD